ncbi:phosphate acyltransferase [Spirochaeta isovalerica]|uniref:Phosphate butyryltransferase n=1 Tax=Spirochaeta isovalerica TaxID=150 RepID=A0A841R1I0_9SPIO|nr:phosphate acyltransferase [Spirochaeta isovalerica]MBB6478844.1 phosphate butyryltransferase [Spirochaeta isovalerica]
MTFQDLAEKLKGGQKPIIAVVAPTGENIYSALKEVEKEGICTFLLVGEEDQIEKECSLFDLNQYAVLSSGNPADDAVDAVLQGKAHVLMKGKVDTSVFMKAVLKRKDELMKSALLSHILVAETAEGKLLGVTDGGMVIDPDLQQKAAITQNAIDVFNNLGVINPKAAVLTAMERVNPSIPASLDAALLSKMAERGQISGGIVDGPLAIDLALSKRACEIKGLKGPVQGDADILVVPDMNTGNIFGKSLILCAGFPSGGMIAGASFPIIMLSRADQASEKKNSIILALAAAGV